MSKEYWLEIRGRTRGESWTVRATNAIDLKNGIEEIKEALWTPPEVSEPSLMQKCQQRIKGIVQEQELGLWDKCIWKALIISEGFNHRLYCRACRALVTEGFMAEPEGWVRGQDKVYVICQDSAKQ